MKTERQRAKGRACRGGRPRKFTPERFEEVFEEYKKWAKETPIRVNRVSAGQTVSVPCERPLTLTGFCLFAGISRSSFHNYEAQEEFSFLLTYIREAIEADQLRGAMVGMYESAIVTRVLRLADRQNVTTNERGLRTSDLVIEVTLDAEAASIIQSIRQQTIHK